jgi:ABC-type dipeptide/oligopeptide/nickel transport system permease subunit
MRTTDIMMAFPIFLFAIALIAITSPSLTNIIIVIAILYWTTTARIIYGMVLSLREREFVEAARALGASDPEFCFVHPPASAVGHHRVHHTWRGNNRSGRSCAQLCGHRRSAPTWVET